MQTPPHPPGGDVSIISLHFMNYYTNIDTIGLFADIIILGAKLYVVAIWMGTGKNK
jgi:hypothetical protein